jgi:hypothetical protein
MEFKKYTSMGADVMLGKWGQHVLPVYSFQVKAAIV